MRNTLALVLSTVSMFVGASPGAEPGWSVPVNGLRGRLIVDGVCETDGYVNVFVELENTGPRALSVATGDPTVLCPRLTDAAGVDIPPTRISADVARGRSWHRIESRERLTFLASRRPAEGDHAPQIDLVTHAWRLDPGRRRHLDGMLSATLRSPDGPGGGRPRDAWAGEIDMPVHLIRVFATPPGCLGAPCDQHCLVSLADGFQMAQWQTPASNCPTIVRLVGPDGVVRRTWTGWRFFLVAPVVPRTRREVPLAGVMRSERRADFVTDLTGDGVPEVCLMEWTGGAHAAFTYWVVSLGEEPAVLRELVLGNSHLLIVDLDGDGVRELATTDDRFAYVYGCYALSPRPPMVFEWRDGGYRIATDRHFARLVEAMPDARRYDGDETRRDVRRVLAKDWPAWLDSARRTGRPGISDLSKPFMTVLRTVLGKYYRGRPVEAFEFLDRVWPDDVPGKAEYVARLRKELAGSRFRADLDAMFERATPHADPTDCRAMASHKVD